jgi:hypothetical protein
MSKRGLFILFVTMYLLASCITIEVEDNRRTITLTGSIITATAEIPTNTPPSFTPTPEPIIPTPTFTPSPLPLPTNTPLATSTQTNEAERFRFAPGTSVIRLADQFNGQKRYVFRAFENQVTTMAVVPKELKLSVWGQDGTILKSPEDGLSFWRGTLPTTQNYFIEISQDGETSFDLTVIVNPRGQMVQWFGYRNDTYRFELTYPDYFFSDLVIGIPLIKGFAGLKLDLVDSNFFRGTNLDEVSFVAGGNDDPTIVETCLEPGTEYNEEKLADEIVGEFTFSKSAARDVFMGQVFEKTFYRTVYQNVCYEIIFQINYTPIEFFDQSVTKAFDRGAILEELHEILATLQFSEE